MSSFPTQDELILFGWSLEDAGAGGTAHEKILAISPGDLSQKKVAIAFSSTDIRRKQTYAGYPRHKHKEAHLLLQVRLGLGVVEAAVGDLPDDRPQVAVGRPS